MDGAPKGRDAMMSISRRDPPKRCPRCESTNTKFCYFNNYSQSQPRHFCRACRRYWTEGGTLRNVPQGGGSYRRGNKRSRRAPPPPPPRPPAPATTGSEVTIAAAPPLQPPPPPPAPFIFGGGDGMMTAVLRPFHPGCAGMMPDFLGFSSASDPMMPGLFNLPMHPPMQPPAFDANLMIGQQPRLAVTSHQQMNITVFTSSPAAAAAAAGSNVSSAGAGNREGYWKEFNNEGEDDSPQPPTP